MADARTAWCSRSQFRTAWRTSLPRSAISVEFVEEGPATVVARLTSLVD